jgi:HlyD family secretion protein
LLLIALAIGSYFIHYPDIVHARAKLNSINPPKPVITKTGGRIVKLFMGDGWEIKKMILSAIWKAQQATMK